MFSSLRLSFYLKLSGRSGRSCLLSLLLGYNVSQYTDYSRETMQLMHWPGVVRYSCLLQSIAIALLLLFVSTLFFTKTGGILPYLNSLTLRYYPCPLKYLCFLVTFAIGRIENRSSSTCSHSIHDISNLILHCPAIYSLCRLLFVTLRSLFQDFKSGAASGVSWSSAILPSLGRGRVTTTTKTT